MRLLGNLYAAATFREFSSNVPRLPIFDQFAGQLTEKCVKAMARYRKLPVVNWGGLTPLLQPADPY